LTKIKIDLGVQMLRQKLLSNIVIETEDKISSLKMHMPKVMEKMYYEDRERKVGLAEDEARLLLDFEKRKSDHHYYMLMQKRNKSNLKKKK